LGKIDELAERSQGPAVGLDVGVQPGVQGAEADSGQAGGGMDAQGSAVQGLTRCHLGRALPITRADAVAK
jgi:hypothetical protein